VQKTKAERFWKWFMERFAGGRNVMLATGGGSELPSSHNPNIHWIFATSLREQELKACARRREYPDKVRLIIACRQKKNKGTDVVIGSLPLILKDFPGTTLDVVGDGPALTEFKALAATLGVDNHITFHGKVEHGTVIRLLQQAGLLCYPTTASEGFPKVVHEALACGLPVITTPVSVLPQLIGTGCGILIEQASPTAVAQAVRACLSDSAHYSAMSAQAIGTAGRYSLEAWRNTIGASLRAAWGPPRTDV
jgi:glycosyltransferase involved in cell wall biosynthesis